jgi:hypothetical protein
MRILARSNIRMNRKEEQFIIYSPAPRAIEKLKRIQLNQLITGTGLEIADNYTDRHKLCVTAAQ